MKRLADFGSIYRSYRRFHSPLYSARTAWRCAFLNWSF